MVRAGRHHLDALAGREAAVDHAHVRHHTAVGVVDRVEDHGAGRSIRIALRLGDLLHQPVEEPFDAGTGLARDAQHVGRVAADERRELLGVLLGVGRREVDLVEHRDDVQVILEREIEVRERLGLDALGRVDEQDGALAGGQRSGDFVGEVDVARRVDHVQGEGLAVELPRHPHGLALDRDAALALDVHAVQVLGAHVAVGDHARDLEHAVGEGRLAVIDVGDDAEVPDLRRRGRGGLKRGESAWGHVPSILR